MPRMRTEEIKVGINIVKKALEAPIRKLAANAGEDGSVIIDTVRRKALEKKIPTSVSMCLPANMST